MLFKKLLAVFLVALALTTGTALVAYAQDKATPEEVYEMVLKAAQVLEQLGDEGLAAFNDPKGEFVWKDSYIWVLNCEKDEVAAHPNTSLIGLKASAIKDKNEDPAKAKFHNVELCEGAKNPNGIWVEYWWEKLGQDKPARKISFMVQVPGQPYQVTAGIYDETTNIDDLNKSLK